MKILEGSKVEKTVLQQSAVVVLGKSQSYAVLGHGMRREAQTCKYDREIYLLSEVHTRPQ